MRQVHPKAHCTRAQEIINTLRDDNVTFPDGIYSSHPVFDTLVEKGLMTKNDTKNGVSYYLTEAGWVNNGRKNVMCRWSKGGVEFPVVITQKERKLLERQAKPVKVKQPKAVPLPFPSEATDDELDRFKGRLCAVVQNTEQIVKGMTTLNERMAGIENLLGGIARDNGNVAQQLDNVSAALEVIRKRAAHIDSWISGASIAEKKP